MDAEVLGYDLETNLAVIKVNARVLRYLEFGDSDAAGKGQLAFTFGNPGGAQRDAMSIGLISATGVQLRPDDPMAYIQTDAIVTASNTGGPLVDTRGRIIGINTLVEQQLPGGSDRFGFAVPSNIAVNMYEQIRATGSVRRGINVVCVSQSQIIMFLLHFLFLYIF